MDTAYSRTTGCSKYFSLKFNKTENKNDKVKSKQGENNKMRICNKYILTEEKNAFESKYALPAE